MATVFGITEVTEVDVEYKLGCTLRYSTSLPVGCLPLLSKSKSTSTSVITYIIN